MRSVKHVIFLAALVNPRTFRIGRFTAFAIFAVDGAKTRFIHLGFVNAIDKRNHVFFEFRPKQCRVAPIEISLTIIVNPNGRINIMPMRACQMPTFQCILERSLGLIGHSHVDSTATTIESRFDSHVVIILAITTNNLCSPIAIRLSITTEAFVRKNELSHIGPVHHISGARDSPAVHGKEGTAFIVTGIDTDRIAKYDRSRIRRIVRLDNRIFGKSDGCKKSKRNWK